MKKQKQSKRFKFTRKYSFLGAIRIFIPNTCLHIFSSKIIILKNNNKRRNLFKFTILLPCFNEEKKSNCWRLFVSIITFGNDNFIFSLIGLWKFIINIIIVFFVLFYCCCILLIVMRKINEVPCQFVSFEIYQDEMMKYEGEKRKIN